MYCQLLLNILLPHTIVYFCVLQKLCIYWFYSLSLLWFFLLGKRFWSLIKMPLLSLILQAVFSSQSRQFIRGYLIFKNCKMTYRGGMVLQKPMVSQNFRRISRVSQPRFLAVICIPQSRFFSQSCLAVSIFFKAEKVVYYRFVYFCW